MVKVELELEMSILRTDFFLNSELKHMLWVLKRTVSMRRLF